MYPKNPGYGPVGSYVNTKTVQAISDTGTSWIGAPVRDLNAIVQATNAQYDFFNDLYFVQCDAVGLPDLILTIGSQQYKIPQVEYVIDFELTNGNCALTLFPMEGGGFGPSWILGDTFIRTYCNFYDIGNQQIGFSLAHHSNI
uniref:Peptidase A1 domain-containing protein n=1 Tax=Acrobeloides nanus TaxID=290746 RepID=A0A914D5U2_9BILA